MSKTIEVTKYEEMCLDQLEESLNEVLRYVSDEATALRKEKMTVAEQMEAERLALWSHSGKIGAVIKQLSSINEKLKAK